MCLIGSPKPIASASISASVKGVELLSVIRQQQANTPVIIISGLSDQEHARGLSDMGAFDYLVKPFRLEKVEESVGRAPEWRRQLLKLRAVIFG